jgi:mono/diheme cytochrome c family protein/thiol-disulfide isomerase/thioredoxin
MSRLAALSLLLAPLAVLGPALLRGADPAPRPAPPPLDFRLEDPRDEREISFADLKDKKAIVLVFMGTECPIGNSFLPVLAGLHKDCAGKGVAFLGVNSNLQDTPARVAAHARDNEIPFPVLKDVGNRLADRLEAKRTPEALVLDPAGRVLYRGRIDDQFGIGYSRPNKPTRRDLAEAIEEVLAGKAVSVPATPVAGCLIGRVVQPKKVGPVTYSRQVSRILQKHCQECHRPGQIGPMPLMTYDDATAWSDTIREVVDERRMPPWHADPRFGHFANDRRLPDADREALLAWIDGGLPRGDDKDLPPPREFPKGWRIGKPDLIVKMPQPCKVPATAKGGVPYRYFTVDPGFTEDRWVQRAEAKADATPVVHHIVVFILPKGQVVPDPEGPGSILCGTAPGDLPLVLPPGCAKKLPAGAKLVFQMHYTPNGKEYADQSSVGIIFAKGPPEHRVLTKPIHNPNFVLRLDKIPAGAGNYRMEAEHTFRRDAHIISFMPHMHLRGKDFLYEAVSADGKTETLLLVPRYQFSWQSGYRNREPLTVPRGTKIHCVAHFDNSAKNPSNPDPSRDVYWGDQTWEEMMVGWIEYYYDSEKP